MELPVDVIGLILEPLSLSERCIVSLSCQRWQSIVVERTHELRVDAGHLGRAFHNETLRLLLLRFTLLQTLQLTSAHYVTEMGFDKLTLVSDLKRLELQACKNIGLHGLKVLLSLAHLTALTLDASLQHFRENDGYMAPVALHVYEQYIDTYAPLFRSGLPAMRSLRLIRWTRISHKLIASWLSCFPKLAQFALDAVVDISSVTRKALSPIASVPSLTSLSLQSNALTNIKLLAAIVPEQGPPIFPLTELFLNGNPKLTPQAIEQLIASLATLELLGIEHCDGIQIAVSGNINAHFNAFTTKPVRILT